MHAATACRAGHALLHAGRFLGSSASGIGIIPNSCIAQQYLKQSRDSDSVDASNVRENCMQRVLEAGCRSWGGVLHPNVPCMRPAGRSELELVFQASLTHPEERPLDCLPFQVSVSL
jgi:hypothetical protein